MCESESVCLSLSLSTCLAFESKVRGDMPRSLSTVLYEYRYAVQGGGGGGLFVHIYMNISPSDRLCNLRLAAFAPSHKKVSVN